MNWSTHSQVFYKTVKRKDVMWIVFPAGKEAPTEWRLIERIAVAHPDPKRKFSKWGQYHIIGDKRHSQTFSLSMQPDFTAILWLLKFASGKRIKLLGRRIGQALQSRGFRALAESDVILLDEYAKLLKHRRNTG